MVCHRIALDENDANSFFECVMENEDDSLITNDKIQEK